ncbi:MAG TPA: SBBP repeat-containing protein, partial [Bacteroidia bacterium]|nr:SBBP repeat-containing protein [Bacteroidia bacterium]
MALNTAHTGFIKNAGQVYDYNKQVTPDVFYSLHTKAVSVFLTPKGLTYSIVQREIVNDETDLKFSNKSNFTVIDKKVARVDMCLIDANIKADNIIELSYINDVFVNFYGSTLNRGALNLKQCNQIIIKEVYPHIDWLLHVLEDESFKYDFIVRPGGNVSSIKYKFMGAKNIIANNSADVITIETPLGKLTEGALYCFTSGNDKQIPATYTLVDDGVSLNISVYDKSETLIIDPAVMVLTWATFYGGSSAIGIGATFCRAIKTDSVNNRVYIVGDCFSSPFPNMNNNVAYYFSPAIGGSSAEAFITAFDLTGKQKWATYYLSTEPDVAFDVEVDNNGNIYMVGSTESHNAPGGINFFTTQYQGGFIQTTNNAKPIVPGIYSYQEGFIVRFNALGHLQWATLLGGDRYDVLLSVTCDKNNNIYVCGVTDSQSKLPTNKQGNG